MVNPNEVRPDTATDAEANLPDLEQLTPHPVEFERVSTAVIAKLADPQAQTNDSSVSINTGRQWPETGISSRFGLRIKATLAAITLSVLPTLAIGGLAYKISSNTVEQKIEASITARSSSLADRVNSYMFDRYADVQVFASLPILTNEQVRFATTLDEKQALLEQLRSSYGDTYTSVAAFDLQGDVIAQSTAGKVLGNHFDRSYVQAVYKTGNAVVSQPTVSKTTGEVSLYFAAPILDSTTGEMIGVVRSRMPMTALDPILSNFSQNGEQSHIADQTGNFIATNKPAQLGKNIEEDFVNLQPYINSNQRATLTDVSQSQNSEQLVSYVPFDGYEGLPALGWSAVIGVETDLIFASERQMLAALLLGTTAVAGIIALISVYLATQATKPIINAANAVKDIGMGRLDTRLELPEQGDEIVVLGQNINQMGEQLQGFLESQESDARLESTLTAITRLQSTDELAAPLEQFLQEIQQQMESDRVTFARFLDTSGSSTIIADAAKPDLNRTQGQSLAPFSAEQLARFKEETDALACNQLTTADFPAELLQQLQALQIQSLLCAPVIVSNECYGWLSLQSCHQAHNWNPSEVAQLTQLANRLGLSLTSVESFLQAQRQALQAREQNESLQRELLTLLSDVEEASSGDLTVRAQITDGEIGIVADFFNSIVENLRDIVLQVKQASSQVNSSVSNNGESVRQLSTDATEQATQINVTLTSVEEMTTALQTIARQATDAARASQTAEATAQAGGEAMESTVNSISQVRETVAETAKRVKRLGESSQQISKVVELINQIALKTNLLAVNAGIEAARAGEEGRGFAVVAEEVGALAAQSAMATKDIEQIIAAIQTETSNVVEAMETSTSQVVDGTRSVEEAKQSLEAILEVSRQVNSAFQLISNETTTQANTSEQVKQMMAQVAQVSTETSSASRNVSDSLQATVEITEQLQRSVDAFVVERKA